LSADDIRAVIQSVVGYDAGAIAALCHASPSVQAALTPDVLRAPTHRVARDPLGATRVLCDAPMAVWKALDAESIRPAHDDPAPIRNSGDRRYRPSLGRLVHTAHIRLLGFGSRRSAALPACARRHPSWRRANRPSMPPIGAHGVHPLFFAAVITRVAVPVILRHRSRRRVGRRERETSCAS
jgi:hypothetical protein